MAETSTSGSPAKYDAATGFRDIKGIPEFSPLDSFIYAGGIALAALIAGLLFWRRRKKPKESPTPAADVIAFQELELLLVRWETGEISLRELSHRMSQTIRKFLERLLTFPAEESTVPEMKVLLSPVMTRAFSVIPSSQRQEMTQQIIEILRLCERLSFAPDTENFHEGNRVKIVETIHEIRAAIGTLTNWNAREKQALIANQPKKNSPQETTPVMG